MRLFVLVTLLLLGATPARADALARHFFGSDVPVCSTYREPIVALFDLTTKGEIDDNNSIKLFEDLEDAACVRVLAIVSIFGNGESTTEEIHENLKVRMRELRLWERWGHLLLRGPDHSMLSGRRSDADDVSYRKIASVINASPRPVTLVELGPFTASATLLREGYVSSSQIARVLGVGGRSLGERFATGKRLGILGSFTDFNVRKDTAAVDYLVRYHGSKLSVVTYRTGIGARMVAAKVIADAIPELAEHAHARARFLYRVGYERDMIPSWDTWLTSFFLKGGPKRLGCAPTRARMLQEDGARNLRLILHRPKGMGHTIVACHQ